MKLYTADEIAKLYQIHPKTVYRLGRERKIECVKVGRSVRFIEPTEISESEVSSDDKGCKGNSKSF